MISVVGPPPTNGRGVFVNFWSFCVGIYSVLSVCRCASGSFFYFYFSLFLAVLSIVAVFFFGWVRGGCSFFWGGVGEGVITSCRLRFTCPRCLVLRYDMFPKNFGRS